MTESDRIVLEKIEQAMITQLVKRDKWIYELTLQECTIIILIQKYRRNIHTIILLDE